MVCDQGTAPTRGHRAFPGARLWAASLLAGLTLVACDSDEPAASASDGLVADVGGGAGGVDGGGTADAGGAEACGPGRSLPDAGCCEAPTVAALGGGVCMTTGPAGCEAAAAAGDLSCQPNWCRVGSSCELDDVGCFKGLRACSPEMGHSCAAASWPSPQAEYACVPAGLDAQVGAAPMPRWCAGDPATGACAPTEVGCEPGQWPTSDGCRPVGPAWLCPPGFVEEPSGGSVPDCVPDPADCLPWAPVAGAIHVDASAPAADADGTFARPYPDLGQAVAAAPAGATLVVNAGTYGVQATATLPMTIRGSCAAQVAFVHVADTPILSLGKLGTGTVRLERAHLIAKDTGVSVQDSGLALELDRVWITGSIHYGVGSYGQTSVVSIRDTVIAGGLPASGGDLVWGVAVMSHAQVTVERLRLSRASAVVAAKEAGTPSTLRGEGLVIADAGLGFLVEGVDSAALVAMNNALIDVQTVRVDGAHDLGVLAEQYSTVLLGDTRIDATHASASPDAGHGVKARNATVGLRGVSVRGSDRAGLVVGPDSTLTAVGSVIEGLAGSGHAPAGADLVVGSPASATLRASRIDGPAAVGVLVGGPGAQLVATGVLIGGTGSGDDAAPPARIGVQVSDGGAVDLWGSAVRGAAAVGVLIADGGTLRAMGTTFEPEAPGGAMTRGIELRGADSSATIVGSRIRGGGESGVRVAGGAALKVVGTIIEGSPAGTALTGLSGAKLDLEASSVGAGAGTALRMAGGDLAARHVVVGGAVTTNEQTGDGAIIDEGATMSLERASVLGNHRSGIVAKQGSTTVLQSSVVTGNLVGVVSDDGANVNLEEAAVFGNAGDLDPTPPLAVPAVPQSDTPIVELGL